MSVIVNQLYTHKSIRKEIFIKAPVKALTGGSLNKSTQKRVAGFIKVSKKMPAKSKLHSCVT